MPIQIALLGCGHPHLSDLLGVLASEPGLRLAAAWDDDSSAVPVALSGAQVRRADTAIARADAVVVSAPTDQRPALAVAAARAGRPVLMEKPVARTAAEAEALLRELRKTRTPAVAALFLRELPALQRLRGVLAERLLGRIASVTASFSHPGALDRMFEGATAWMRDPGRAGVGAFGDLGLHLVDALAWLPGDEPPQLAAAALDVDRLGQLEVGGIAVGRWAGAPLALGASWAERPGGLTLVVSGAAATATVRGGTLELDSGRGEAERWVGAPPDAGESLRAFAALLRTRRLPCDGLLPAVRAQAIIEAVAGRR